MSKSGQKVFAPLLPLKSTVSWVIVTTKTDLISQQPVFSAYQPLPGVQLVRVQRRKQCAKKLKKRAVFCALPSLSERLEEARMSRTVFTDLYNLALSGSSRLLSRYALPLVRLRLRSTVQLGLSLWPRELEKPPWSRDRRRRLLHSVIRNITRRKSWKIKFFQEPVGRIAKGSFIDHIFM